jgi:dihydrofolate reductase
MIEKNIIAAVANNMAIGKNNKMPWHISGDSKYFKEITSGHPVIMGRKTYESIGKPLPNRTNIVLSHKYLDGVIIVNSLEEAYQKAEEIDDVCFVIGGGKLYKDAIEDADRLYITCVYTDVEDADTYFPDIDMRIWEEESVSDIKEDPKTRLKYYFVIYKKRV